MEEWLMSCRDAALFVLITHWIAISVACLEIEIEGTGGWAANLPTWRLRTPLCGTRPLTGYHVALSITLISAFSCGGIVDAILFQSLRALTLVLISLGMFVCVMLFEDAYWFTLNYNYHEAVASGLAQNHFQSKRDQLSLHFMCAIVGSVLIILGYGAIDMWQRGGIAVGFYWLFSWAAYAIVQIGVRPLYIVLNGHMHGKKIIRGRQLLCQSAVVLTGSSIVIVAWIVAIGVWQWA